MTNETDPVAGPDQQPPSRAADPVGETASGGREASRPATPSSPSSPRGAEAPSRLADSADPAGPATPDATEPSSPQAHAAASRPATSNPFAGIPVSDYVRDGVAVLLLFVSLTMRWDFGHKSSDRVEVILVTVLALLALTLPYLARTGVLPETWTVHTTRRARLVATAPYGLLVVVYLVLDLVNGATLNGWGGVGSGLALGLAGALLAAQPRQAELGPVDQDRGVTQVWVRVLLAIGGLAVAGALVAFAFSLTTGQGVIGVFLSLLAAVLTVALVGLPVWGVLRGQESSRLVLVGLGIALVVLFVLNTGNVQVSLESLRGAHFGLLLIPAAAAVAASPALARSTTSGSRVDTWVAVAVGTLDLTLVVAAVLSLSAVLWLALGASEAVVILALVFGLLMVGVALVARRALLRDPVSGRTLALGAAGVVAILGIVLLIVAANQSEPSLGVSLDMLLLAFGLPAIVVFALTVPVEVRTHFAEHRPSSLVGADAAPSAYVWQPPAPRPVRPKPQEPVAGPYGSGSYATGPDGYGPEAGEVQHDQGAPSEPAARPARPARSPQVAGHQVRPQADRESTQPVRQDPVRQPRPVEEFQPTQVLPAQGAQSSLPVQPVVPERSGYAARPGYAAQAAGETAVMPAYQDPQPRGFTAAQALDPSTPLEVLAQIVQEAPHLRAQVAANPSTYPALLEWLGNLGDPAVDAALRSRGR